MQIKFTKQVTIKILLTHPEGGTLLPLGDGGGGFDGPDI